MGILYPANSAILAPSAICFSVKGVFFIGTKLAANVNGNRLPFAFDLILKKAIWKIGLGAAVQFN